MKTSLKRRLRCSKGMRRRTSMAGGNKKAPLSRDKLRNAATGGQCNVRNNVSERMLADGKVIRAAPSRIFQTLFSLPFVRLLCYFDVMRSVYERYFRFFGSGFTIGRAGGMVEKD